MAILPTKIEFRAKLTMPLNYSTLHKLKREAPGAEVVLETARPNTNHNKKHQALFDALKHGFHTHTKKQYGHFDTSRGENPLHTLLNDYYKDKVEFRSLSKNLAEQLLQLLHQYVEQVFEYYLWVAVEEVSRCDQLYLFLLRHDEGHFITPKITVEDHYSIHPERLQYAAKIDLKGCCKDRTNTYLSYLSLKVSSPVAIAFNNFIGFSEGVNRATQTEEFLNIVEEYANNLPADKEQEYRHRVIDYCVDQDRQGEPVALKALSRYVDESSPDAFMRFITDNQEESSLELYTDRNSLKRYTRFFGRDQDISISFSTAVFGNNIIYDERSDTLTIRSIPKSLKLQLKKYLKKVG